MAGKTDERKQNTPRKRRKKRLSIFRFILLGLFAVVIGAVLSLTVFFHIRIINVKGETRYTSNEVINASTIPYDKNMFLLNKDKIAQKIEKTLPYIESAQISRKLPDCIVINVKEAKPTFSIMGKISFSLLSENMKVLQTKLPITPGDIPAVYGLDFEAEPEEGSYLPSEDPRISSLKILLEAIKKAGNDIETIDISNIADIVLTYDGGRLTVYIGTVSDIDYKLEYIDFLIDEKLDEKESGTIDARMATPGRVTFRGDN